jgi:hypothetical protein
MLFNCEVSLDAEGPGDLSHCPSAFVPPQPAAPLRWGRRAQERIRGGCGMGSCLFLLALPGPASQLVTRPSQAWHSLVSQVAMGMGEARARRSGWPDLFLNAEACVNTEGLISTSEAYFKRD